MMYQDLIAYKPLFHPAFLLGIIALSLWSLVWKGLALWRAGRRGDKVWFVLLLIINTAGILEILYLLFFSKSAPTNNGQN